MSTLIQKSKTKYWYGLMRKVRKRRKTPDANQVNACLTTKVWKICIFVQNKGKKVNESFDSPINIEYTFSTSLFNEKPRIDVSAIEYFIKE